MEARTPDMGACTFTMNFLPASAGRCTAGALPSLHCRPFLVAFFICLSGWLKGTCRHSNDAAELALQVAPSNGEHCVRTNADVEAIEQRATATNPAETCAVVLCCMQDSRAAAKPFTPCCCYVAARYQEHGDAVQHSL